MTLRCAIHATLDENVASDESGGVAVIERNLPLAPETLGLTLTEGHALLHNIQAQLVTAQVAAWQAGRRPCPGFSFPEEEPRGLSEVLASAQHRELMLATITLSNRLLVQAAVPGMYLQQARCDRSRQCLGGR